MTARFKQRLLARQRVILMNPDHPSPSLVEFIGQLGVDAVMIDTEQGSPDAERVEEMARAARACGLCALVRLFSPEPWVIERLLFRGVHGIVAPRVDTADQARAVVETVRYCFPMNHAEKTVIVQVETAQAVAELDALLAIEGIDGFFVGPVDLAKSLGHQGNYREATVTTLIGEIIARIAAAGRPAGMLVTAADVAFWVTQGATLLYTHLNEYAALGARVFGDAAQAV